MTARHRKVAFGMDLPDSPARIPFMDCPSVPSVERAPYRFKYLNASPEDLYGPSASDQLRDMLIRQGALRASLADQHRRAKALVPQVDYLTPEEMHAEILAAGKRASESTQKWDTHE